MQRTVWLLLIAVLGALAGPSLAAERLRHPQYEPPDPEGFLGAPNLFLRAKATASGHSGDRVADFAVDGRRDPGGYWASENQPAWLTLDLKAAREMNVIRVWPRWGTGQACKYLIEGSRDGQSWTKLADYRHNTQPSGENGDTFAFAAQKVRFVRVTFARDGGHLVEIEGYSVDPAKLEAEKTTLEGWRKVPAGLQGSFVSVDERYARDRVPDVTGVTTWTATAWRGERLNAQIALWSTSAVEQMRFAVSPLAITTSETLGTASLCPRFVRYTLGEGVPCADILDTAPQLDLAAGSTRPVWVTLDIPRDAESGLYKGCLTVRALGDVKLPFSFEVRVLPHVLPEPRDWQFHLDLWQNPYAIARWHGVEPWTPEFFRLAEPYYRMLAEAGQKCLTVSAIYEPWGGQTYDSYETMIAWIRKPDGSWRYDFSVFDAYVMFGAQCGLDKQIHCYSMLPWSNQIRYLDEAKGDYVTATVLPGEKQYEEFWRPFLEAFHAHLTEKGWLNRTFMAMDERDPGQMKAAIELVQRFAPGIRIASAENRAPEIADLIQDWSMAIDVAAAPEIAEMVRKRTQGAEDRETTFYVCGGPARPNTFTFSPPAESAWMGLHAAARGYTGFLRWAYNCWTADPFLDTNHVAWPAGDCFLIYPGPRSSIRFERLREGIQDYEKIRLLCPAVAGNQDPEVRGALERVNAALSQVTFENARQKPAAEAVNAVKKELETLSRLTSER
jgi:hypothetical protein